MALFKCSCGCLESVCIRTNAKPDETVRKRRCLKCGNVFETTELMVSQVKVLRPAEALDDSKPKTKKSSKQSRQAKPEEKPESALDKAMKGITS